MKKLILVSLAAILSINALAQDSGTGIGAIIGTNVHFTAKFWTGETTAFAAAIGFDYYSSNVYGYSGYSGSGGYGGLNLTGDYLFHLWSFDLGQDMMKVYFGPGIGIGYSTYSYSYYYTLNSYSRLWLTVRAPGGVGYYFHNIPLECFVEFAPGLDIFGPQGLHSRFRSYIGARWYF